MPSNEMSIGTARAVVGRVGWLNPSAVGQRRVFAVSPQTLQCSTQLEFIRTKHPEGGALCLQRDTGLFAGDRIGIDCIALKWVGIETIQAGKGQVVGNAFENDGYP